MYYIGDLETVWQIIFVVPYKVRDVTACVPCVEETGNDNFVRKSNGEGPRNSPKQLLLLTFLVSVGAVLSSWEHDNPIFLRRFPQCFQVNA